MFRIAALNSVDSNENDEIQIAKEAQEAIVESEYIRALTLKNQGQSEVAQKLLTELLQTHILNEGVKENVEKLWAIRYNCHKYLAFIAEENEDNEAAFHNYMAAMQIDNSDVHTIYRFGELLLLKLSNFELAEYVFETCLLHNSRHWRAAEGLLSVYVKTNNIMASYGLSLKLITNNVPSKHVVNIMKEILTKFSHLVPLCEKVYGKVPHNLLRQQSTSTFAYFALAIKSEEDDDDQAAIKNEIKRPIDLPKLNAADNLSYHAIGKYILSTIAYLKEKNIHDMLTLTFSDICALKAESEVSPVNDGDDSSSKLLNEFGAIASNLLSEIESNAEQELSENMGSKSDEETSKAKSRRRCSDLHHLEQWGWHKTRKASRRKTQTERTDVDNSLTGFLKRAFAKYTETNFNNFSWPFNNSTESNNIDTEELKCVVCRETSTLSDFENETKEIFTKFIEKLKIEKFDLMLLNFWWLRNMSNFWCKPLPKELKSLYIDLFGLYVQTFDFSTWNQLKTTTFVASVQICLLYLELEYTKAADENRALSDLWTKTFHHLLFHYGCAVVECGSEQRILYLRTMNLEFLRYDLDNQCEQCVQSLSLIAEILKAQPEPFVVHFPNMKSICLSYDNVINMRKKQERIIDLKKMPQMATKHEWFELSLLIKKYIQNTENRYKCNNWLIDFKNINELLLQCLWNIAEYEECLIYAEKFLHYSTYYYLQEQKTHWSKAITFALSYIEAIILNEGYDIVNVLEESLARLIQNLINILSYQLDPSADKKSYFVDEPEMRRSWLILHQVLIRNENLEPITEQNDTPDSKTTTDEPIPMSFMLLFTAHEYLGNRQTCTSDGGQFLIYIFKAIIPNLRAPIYDGCRIYTYEYIEQITFCLYGFPPKKGRSRHLEDHNSTLMDLTWPTAIEIFDFYAPETLPEFNSYKVESITIDMEQFLLKILSLMPKELEPLSATQNFKLIISGVKTNEISDELGKLPFKIKNIYYLLADYYFKSRDFQKAIKYYIYDLSVNMQRFDSWAGISLSKASIIETKLNGLIQIDIPQFLKECEEVIACFDKCINLIQNHILVWIEYGSFAYTIGAFCSRNLKTASNDAAVSYLLEKKSRMLNIAYNCFSLAATLQNSDVVNLESYEEKWLCQYMLGKIAEKRRDKPSVYLNYYLTASNYLYECSATYPIKINHNSPTTLSVEALEVFYRTNAAILKYVQSGTEVTKEVAIFFKNVLHTLSNSPFAFNKAKIDGNCIYALKRKNEEPGESTANKKVCEQAMPATTSTAMVTAEMERNENEDESGSSTSKSDNVDENKTSETKKIDDVRRSSQESSATSNTTSTTSTSSLSNFESDSDSSSLDNQNEKSTNMSIVELESIYKEVLKNLEECLIRFPEHYKSIYRLVHFYMNGPKKYHDLGQCEKLLLHQYRTRLGNIINGLFYDRKANNIFNGVWRIPSSEIDRPGSFSAHLVKCVRMLIELLRKQNNYKMFIDIILQLYRSPDNDKRYIMETDRISLFETAFQYCEDIMTDILKKNKLSRNDVELLNLLIDIYKIQKKCYKYAAQKNVWFSKIFVNVYTFYIEDKIKNRPPDLNYYDLAVKLCIQEINYRKNLGRFNNPVVPQTQTNTLPAVTPTPTLTPTTTLAAEDYTRFIEYCKQLIERGQQPIEDLHEMATTSTGALPLSMPTFNVVVDSTETMTDNANYTIDNNKRI